MVYRTEDEQLEAIKKVWHKYGNWLLLLLLLVSLTVAGFKYWNWHITKKQTQSSNIYEYLMDAVAQQDEKRIFANADILITEHAHTVYADAARFALAKLYVARKKYSQAKTLLTFVITNSRIKVLKQMARIRVARILLAEKSYDRVSEILNVVDYDAYEPLIQELKGDLYQATGKYTEAKTLYQKALTAERLQGINNSFLEMKLDAINSQSFAY